MSKTLLLAPQSASTERLAHEAGRLGLPMDIAAIEDLVFVTDRGHTGVFYDGRNVIDVYNSLVVRDFHPHISEALTIASLFRAAGHVVIDENLTTQGYSISKMHDYLMLASYGINVPETYQCFSLNDAVEKASVLGFPLVLKSIYGSHGNHVYLINDEASLKTKWGEYMAGRLMIQKFLPAKEDYRVITIGYKALPLYVSRQPMAGDFRTNFGLSANWHVGQLAKRPDLRELAEKSAHVLGREFSAIDIREGFVLEVNRRPGFDGFDSATGLNVAAEFIDYVKKRVSPMK